MSFYDLLREASILSNPISAPLRVEGGTSRLGAKIQSPIARPPNREFGFITQPDTRFGFRAIVPAPQNSPSYAYSSPPTTSGEGLPIPKIYGKFKNGGHVIGSYSSQGSLYLLISFGFGPAVDISDIRINGNPWDTYPGLNIEIALNGGNISFFPGVFYPGLILLGIKALDLQFINAQTQISAIIDSGISNPADVAQDILTNVNYGAGLSLSQIDSASFTKWREFCSTKNIQFNGIFDQVVDIDNALAQVAFVGYAAIKRGHKKYSVIIDSTGGSMQSFSAEDILQDSVTVTLDSKLGRANEIVVAFNNAQDGYRSQLITVQDIQTGEAIRTSHISLFGVTDSQQALDRAWFQLMLNRIYKTIEFTVRPTTETFKRIEGEIINLTHPLYTGPLKITSIRRGPELLTTFTGIKYDAALYTSSPTSQNLQPYIYDIGSATVTQLTGHEDSDDNGNPIFILSWQPGDLTEGVRIFVQVNNSGNFLFNGEVAHQTTYTLSTVALKVLSPTGSYLYETRKIQAGDYLRIYVVGFDTDGILDPILSSPSITASIAGGVGGNLQRPDDVTNFRASQSGGHITFSWDLVAQKIDFYELRYHPDLSGVIWDSANIVGTALSSPVTFLSVSSGTWLIKAVIELSAGRLESENAASLIIS